MATWTVLSREKDEDGETTTWLVETSPPADEAPKPNQQQPQES